MLQLFIRWKKQVESEERFLSMTTIMCVEEGKQAIKYNASELVTPSFHVFLLNFVLSPMALRALF